MQNNSKNILKVFVNKNQNGITKNLENYPEYDLK